MYYSYQRPTGPNEGSLIRTVFYDSFTGTVWLGYQKSDIEI